MKNDDRLLVLAQALADPLRLSVLQHLMGGPATVSELMVVAEAAQSKVSNHLALLRKSALVRTTRQGRQVVYELRDPSVAQLLESMIQLAGARTPTTYKSAPIVQARTCYDHLAGKLGVALFDALLARDAIEPPEAAGASVELGSAGAAVFGKLGADLPSLRRGRRRFATACLDWTERRPHLGGALGAALWAACIERGWVVRQPGSRAVILTGAGRQALARDLGVRLSPAIQ